jgi:TPR repeat protein
MVEQAPQFRSGPDIDTFENTAYRRVAPYNSRQSDRADIYRENSIPLFLSDSNGEPDPSEYITPVRKKKNSISLRILIGVCAAAAAAILFAMFSSDATRNVVVNLKASAFPVPSAAAQSDPARDRQLSGLDRPKAPENQTPGVRVATAAVAPSREEIKSAYQSALQGRAPAAPVIATAPAAADVVEPPKDVIHHLDPGVVASLLSRADALIASGDLAAARLVLRRAAEAGDARAAMTLAGTYDPAILEKLGVHGFVPDVAMAQSWYEKAKRFGSAEAPQRLEMLANKRQ